ncbi:RNA polymerase sigma-H factor [bioreactor metagenome]|uniref:RNA polymerase sigma-H factor n=1 Tax=bioreactor metagenome TaxID=1076179 RepID=A0A645CSQ8_9ZZZZ|nr:sigma-70 family RNA polymerase sigma factor [Oscillospiraceae bacterium]
MNDRSVHDPHAAGEDGDILSLIYRARGSDQDAFRFISERYKAMLCGIVRGLIRPGVEFDDLYQEGLIALFKAVMLYNPDYSSFSTFSYLCMKRAVISAYRKSVRSGSAEIPDSSSPSDPDNDFSGDEQLYNTFVFPDNSVTPESLYLDKESTELLFKKIDGLLSRYENEVLRLFLTEKSYDEIASALGVSRKSVDNALSRIRSKLKMLFD